MTNRTVSGWKSSTGLGAGLALLVLGVGCGRGGDAAREEPADEQDVAYVATPERQEDDLRATEQRRVGEEVARVEPGKGEAEEVTAETIVRVPSREPARQTMQRLEGELRQRNMQVVSRLDLAARPTRGEVPAPLWLVLFRDSDREALASEDPTLALALPNQYLVFEDPAGNAFVAYESPTRRLEQAGLSELADRVEGLESRLREVAHAAAGNPAEEARGEGPMGMDDRGTLPGAQPGGEEVLQDRPGAGTGTGPAQRTHGATGAPTRRPDPATSGGNSPPTGTNDTIDGTSGGGRTVAPGAGPTGAGGADEETR